MTATTLSDAHARARAAFLEKREPDSVTVVHGGVTVEVRQPTLEARSWVHEGARFGDDGKLQIDFATVSARAVIVCTFVPGTATPVFTRADEAGLKSQVVGGGADKLVQAAVRMIGVNAGDVDKLAARALQLLKKPKK